MKIKYQVDPADCFVFSDHLLKTSPLLKKTIRKGQMWWAAGPLLGGLAISIIKGASPLDTLKILAVLSAFLSLPMSLLYRPYFKFNNQRQIKKLVERGKLNGILGSHQMTISEGCLTDHTDANANEITWSSVSSIETIADYTFIYTDEATAYIVPHSKLTEGNAERFMERLADIYQRARD